MYTHVRTPQREKQKVWNNCRGCRAVASVTRSVQCIGAEMPHVNAHAGLHALGIESTIAADKLAVSLITDIAADNDGRFAAEVHPVETRAQAAAGQESDTWEELDDKWVIHHRVPRSAFFVPTPGLQSGPNPDELDSARETTVVYASMPTYETHQFVPESGVPIENGFVLRDNWRQSKARVLRDRWTGKTIFFKTLLVAALADKTVVGATADSISEHQSVLPSALSAFESPSVRLFSCIIYLTDCYCVFYV